MEEVPLIVVYLFILMLVYYLNQAAIKKSFLKTAPKGLPSKNFFENILILTLIYSFIVAIIISSLGISTPFISFDFEARFKFISKFILLGFTVMVMFK